MNEPQVTWLPDGRRLHMNHGPIDLVVEAFGAPHEVRAAYQQASARFRTILEELVAELPALRSPAVTMPRPFAGATAGRMEQAVARLAHIAFLTPMAAVAGSVADEVLDAMRVGRSLDRAYVNNGGDVALHVAPGQAITVAVAGTGPARTDRLTIRHGDAPRGIATSGWRGRSFSLGIADAVTVLAESAAAADAAATLVANAVDLPGHSAITRVPAIRLQPDTDLGHRLVTTGVGLLSADDVDLALARGVAVADHLRRRKLIAGAALFLAGEMRVAGTLPEFAEPVAEQPAPRRGLRLVSSRG